MKFKLAKQTLDSKSKEISLDDLIKIILDKKVVFLDSDNKDSDVKKIANSLEDYKVYINIVKFGLGENEFIYEVHIL